MKKFLATLLVVVTAMSLCACGGGKKDDKTTLQMWCIATVADSNRHSYEAAIKDMEAKYPNVKLEWEAIENEAYKTKIKAAVTGNAMPDIFFTWSCAFLEDFVKADRVYCLDEAYKAFANDLPEKMCKNTTYEGKKYGVPLTMNIVGLFANMDLLKKVGYTEVPGTYNELIACCDKLVEAGIIPFGCAGKETWCVTEYLESIIEKNIGAQALDDVFLGRATWDNQGIADSVKIFQEMIAKKYFDPDGVALSNDEVKANFQSGKYAFYMNGTWNCADFSKDDNFKDKVKVAEFPVINSSASKLGQLIGGPSDTLAVAKSSKNAALAAEFTLNLGKLICKYGYLDGCGLPAWKVDYDISTVNPLTQTVSEIVNNSDYMVLFGDTAQNATDAQKYLEFVAKVYTEDVTPADFIAGLKKAIR